MSWAPDESINQHLEEIRNRVHDPDSAPHQILTPILYMMAQDQHIGWGLAEPWLREKRVRLLVAAPDRRGCFTLAVMWFPTRQSRIHFDCRLGHKLTRSPEGVAAQALNLRYISGLPIQMAKRAPDPDTLRWIHVVGPLSRYLGRSDSWSAKPSRDFPWSIRWNIMHKRPKYGHPFGPSHILRIKTAGPIEFLGIKELPQEEKGWRELDHSMEDRLQVISEDVSKHLSPLQTTTAPWR
jgi:hypothetical protein